MFTCKLPFTQQVYTVTVGVNFALKIVTFETRNNVATFISLISKFSVAYTCYIPLSCQVTKRYLGLGRLG
jgi:hypothetical protein